MARPAPHRNAGEPDEYGVTGLLVPPHDPHALAAAIVRLLTDHPLADILARNGYRLVREGFCVERMVSAIEQLYDDGWLAWHARAGAPLPGPVTTAA